MVSAPASSSGCRLGLRAVELAALDELHEALADVLLNAHVVLELPLGIQILGRLEGAGRGEHADHAAARAEGGRLHGRLHPDEGDVKLRAQGRDGGAGGRVAGHDDHVRAPVQQQARDDARTLLDVLRALLPVRAVGVVGVVDITFGREDLPYFSQY